MKGEGRDGKGAGDAVERAVKSHATTPRHGCNTQHDTERTRVCDGAKRSKLNSPARSPRHSRRRTRATETGTRLARPLPPLPSSTTPTQPRTPRTGGRFARARCTALARPPSRTPASRLTTPAPRLRRRESCCCSCSSCSWSCCSIQPELGLARCPEAGCGGGVGVRYNRLRCNRHASIAGVGVRVAEGAERCVGVGV